MMTQSMELAKDIFTVVSVIIALAVFIKGLVEYVHSNAVRRYEKFHQMSIRFDENSDIQKVCELLHNPNASTGPLTKQQKEVFICFMEEVYFMMNSGIIKRDLALYSFGYYAKMALCNEKFWQGLDKNELFYIHFIRFCRLASSYRPSSVHSKGQLAY
jgi:hypothetical protein